MTERAIAPLYLQDPHLLMWVDRPQKFSNVFWSALKSWTRTPSGGNILVQERA